MCGLLFEEAGSKEVGIQDERRGKTDVAIVLGGTLVQKVITVC